ncbi:MAG: 5'-nucleotidase C-terminal domain-containing protein, partial [Rhodoglobus sp.]
MHRRTPVIAASALLALALSGLIAPAAYADGEAPPPVAVDIVSVNDFHGRLAADGAAAGAAVLGGMVDSYRAANPNTIFAGAGDFIGASTFTSFIQQDEPTITALNQMGLEVSSFGNHEFDQGRADVDGRVIPHANWDYLAANIYDRATNQPAFDQYFVKDFGGVTVGFVGAVTEELPSLVSPAGIATLEVKPIVPEINRVADQLSDGDPANGEADVVVLLVHEGAATPDIASATDDSPFGRIVTGADANIDAIVSGHTHLAYNHSIPITGTESVRPVISSGQYGEKYGHMHLTIDPTSHALLSITSEVLPLAGAFPPNAAVAQTVADAVAQANTLGAVKVGDITASFNRAKQAAAGSENRGGESTLGNFVADVQLWATQDSGSQIAFMNPGGLRADLKFPSSSGSDPDGNLTYAEAAGVQPFANTLVTLNVTGDTIRQVLEQQWQPAAASRPMLHIGVSKAFTYTYDPTAAAGSHITAMYLGGVPIDPVASYTVTVNSFLAAGGDNFTAFTQGTNKADTGKIDLQSMVDYFTANPVATPDLGQRAVGVVLSAPDADGYSPGDAVTISLSSLLFSNGEPNAGTAVVSANGVELGSAAIDPAIVDTTDEVGRASVPITIPSDAPAGPLVLTITVPETGTTTTVALTVTIPVLPIESVTAPTISGQPRVGKTLTATGGTWSVPNPTLTYQWSRNGVAVDGATAASYLLTTADAGAAITVTVTASADGFSDGTATSAATVVKKLATTLFGAPTRLVQYGGNLVSYRIVLRADGGVAPTGEVTIYDGQKLLA